MSQRVVLKRGPVPAYHQIMQIVRSQIVSGHYPTDSRLPTEDEYMREFGVGRQTVRLALQHLVNEGMIERYPGRGSFVRARPLAKKWVARDIDELINEPLKGRREVLSRGDVFVRDYPSIVEFFPGFESLHKMQVRRMIGEHVQSVSSIFLRHEISSKIPDESHDRQVIWKSIFEYCGVEAKRIHVWFSAELADKETSRLLDVDIGEVLVVFERIDYDDAGEVLQCSRTLYRPDRRSQTLEFVRNRNVV